MQLLKAHYDTQPFLAAEWGVKTSIARYPVDADITFATDTHSWFYEWVYSPHTEHRKEMMGYIAVLDSDEEGGYVATIPRLPGCITEGDTVDEALAYLRDALEGWMQVAIDKGLEIPEPDGQRAYETAVYSPSEA